MALTPAEVAEKLWMYARLQACESEHRMQPVVAIPKLARIIELMVEDAAEPLAKELFEQMRIRKIETLQKQLEKAQKTASDNKLAFDNLNRSFNASVRNGIMKALQEER